MKKEPTIIVERTPSALGAEGYVYGMVIESQLILERSLEGSETGDVIAAAELAHEWLKLAVDQIKNERLLQWL